MRQVSVTELKNKLSEYLRLVKQGETVEVLDRSIPVARLEGIRQDAVRGNADLDRLLRDGLASRARRKPAVELMRLPPVPCRKDPVQVLLEERGEY